MLRARGRASFCAYVVIEIKANAAIETHFIAGRMIRFSGRMRQISLDAITDAAKHVYQAAVRTPLIKLDLPFPSGGAPAPDVYLKLESLQPIGSFKIRGAWNAVRKLTPGQMKDGVWTVSAGNAAQGVAFAARRPGVPCSVMVMDTAPETKLRSIERLGATIVKASTRRSR